MIKDPLCEYLENGIKLPKKGFGEFVLYLDFDGVLHHEDCRWSPKKGPYLSPWLKPEDGYSLFQHISLLEEVLDPYPDLKIVLSTSWVRSYGCEGAAKRLSQSLKSRVIGATFHRRMDLREFMNAPRGLQVWADVLRRKPKDWIALDDDYLHWPAWCLDKYIKTHPALGISDPSALSQFKSKLYQMCNEKIPREAQ